MSFKNNKYITLANVGEYDKPSSEPLSYISSDPTTLEPDATPEFIDTQITDIFGTAPTSINTLTLGTAPTSINTLTLNALNELTLAVQNAEESNVITNLAAVVATKQSASGDYSVGDDVEIKMGDADEFTLKHHNGGYTHLINSGSTGTLYIDSANVVFRDYDGVPERLKITSTGNVEMGGVLNLTGTDNAHGIDIKNANGRLYFSGKRALEGGTNLLIGEGFPTGNIDLGSRLLITSTGNVGIGTTNPSTTLHVNGRITTNDAAFEHHGTGDLDNTGYAYYSFQNTSSAERGWLGFGASDGSFGVWNNANKPLRFATNGVERMRITSTGNVGIGASTPSAKLHIKSDGSSDVGIGIQNSTRYFAVEVASGGLRVKDVSAGGIERMRIDSTGNVGIGESTPEFPLEIGITSSTSQQVGFEITQATSGNDCRMRFKNTANGQYVRTGIDSGGTWYVEPYNGAYVRRLNVKTNGNVGIGTTSPDTLLTVASTGSAELSINSGTSGISSLYLGDSAQKDKGKISYHNGSDYLYMNVNGAERLRIDSSGRVLVGISGASGFGQLETTTFTTEGQCILARVGGNVGIGQSSPDSQLHLTDTSDVRLLFTTDTTGHTGSDGTFVGITGGNNFIIRQRENAPIDFYTNNQLRLKISNTGNVEMSGNLDVTGILSINGTQIIGTDTMIDANKIKNVPSSWLIGDTNTHRAISDSVSSTSTTVSASSKAVKTAYDMGNHSHPYLPTTGKAADSEKLDGLDSTKYCREIAQASATVGGGWMTVASTTSGRKMGEVHVSDSDSGDHAYIRIDWMRSYYDSNFTVINCGGHSNRITGARVLSQDSDAIYGTKYLQVYVTTSSTYRVQIFQSGEVDGWSNHTVVSPVIQNTISGYSVWGNELTGLDTHSLAAEEGILAGGPIRTNHSYMVDGTTVIETDAKIDANKIKNVPSSWLIGNTTYTAGTNVTISGTNVISSTDSVSPGGADKQIQFNDASSFGGDANLTYDNSTHTLSTINLEVHSIQADPSLTGTYTISAPASITLDPGTEVINMGPMTLVSKTVVELSSLSASSGAMAFCTNETGGSVPAFYDGNAWRRVTDRNIIS